MTFAWNPQRVEALVRMQREGSGPEPTSVADMMARYRASARRLDVTGSEAVARARREAAERARQSAESVRRAAVEAAEREEAARLRLIELAERHELLAKPRRVPAQEIVARVAHEHRFSVEELAGPRRHAPLVTARQAAMAAVYVERPDLSLPQIAKHFGDRDHTTVLHAVRKLGVWRGTAG